MVNAKLKTIYKLGSGLISTLDVNEVLHSIANIVPKFLNVSGCIVRIVDERKGKLKLEAASGISNDFREEIRLLSIGEGISGTAVLTGSPISILDLSKDERVKYSRECATEGVRSVLAVPIIFKKKKLGVIVAFSKRVKHFNRSEINLLCTFAAHAAIALNNALLYNKIHLTYYNTITTLVKTMEARDAYTCGHSERVTSYSMQIAKEINLSKDDIERLLYAGKLHDIGKIAIPDSILKKTTALTATERAEIEAHPIKGIEMIASLKFLGRCFPLIRFHHERFDGNGYPDKLKGKRIPFLARIISVADAFDAMTSERPYRRGLSIDEAIEEIKRNSETQFDPELAKLFISLLPEQPIRRMANETSLQPPIHLAS
jgi:HD-GYP domain-containing protein (c-di-GMP phosphodiesterase class II)